MNMFYVAVIVIIIAILIYLIFYLDRLGRGDWEDTVKSRLKLFGSRYDESDSAVMKSLVIEADALLDYCFKQRSMKGNTMGERLKTTSKLFSKSHYNEIWIAHKLRNTLIHEIDVDVSMKKLILSYRTLTNAVKRMVG